MTMKRRPWITMAVSLALALAGADAMSERLSYPPTKTVSVSDTYFGTVVSDPYRWLENGNDPAVKSWAAAQTKLALGYLEATPAYPGLKARIAELERTPPIRYNLAIRGGHLFYERETPPQAQAELIVLDHLGGAERVLFNPATAAVNGVQPAIETVAVSADGAKVAFTTQFGGSEEETIHVIDVTDGKMLPDTLAHAGGGQSPVAITWDGDGKGFLHTQWPRNPDGSYATAGIRIFHHVLGTDPSTDTYVFGNGLSPKSEYHLATSADGSVQAAAVSDGDGVHASIYLRRNSKPFTLVAAPDAGIGDSDQLGGAFVGNEFYAIATKRNSRGEVVALLPGGTFDTAKVIVPASSVVIDGIVPVGDGFITVDVDGGDSGARLFGADGTQQHVVPVPKISTARIAADPQGGPIIVRYHNYTTNDTWLDVRRQKQHRAQRGLPLDANGRFLEDCGGSRLRLIARRQGANSARDRARRGHQARRLGTDRAVRVRWLRDHHLPLLRAEFACMARAGRRLCGRDGARWRRVR